ncbi:hypothetical protein MMC10_008759 [Thelotrema lepadinum]|nr:hypothetical protein [Thelotrema lepadinum]
MFGDGIFTQEGESWKRSRETLRPQFHHKQYADIDVFRDSVDDLLNNIPKGGGIVDLQPLFFRLTLDITTAFLFGESIHSLRRLNTGDGETFAQAFNKAQEYVVRRFRLMDVYWLIGGKEFKEACKKVNCFADQIIDRNLSMLQKDGESGKDYVFLQALAQKSLDREAIRGQIVNIIAAGRDTTACLLSWTFFLLVRHPIVLRKLQEEIASSVEMSSKLTREDLRGMRYLQNVLKETLRLYPPVPLNIRVASRDTILPTGGGPDRKSPVLIPKNTAVAYSIYTLHRRPDLYGLDVELFRPERWDEPMPLLESETYSRWGYIPFHGGPRICLGMDFALTEAAYTVLQIIQKFPEIKLPEGAPTELVGLEKQSMTLVLSITEGCKVEL